MPPEDVRAFLEGRLVHAFDPQTRARVAQVFYGPDGTCRLRFADGTEDEGDYGFEGELYWTRYRGFRDGALNRFRLQPLAPGLAQAWFTDGARAFLQAHGDDLGAYPAFQAPRP